jgi:hypothetical protein
MIDRIDQRSEFEWLITFQVWCIGVEAHQFDCLIVAASCHEVSHRGPRHAVDGALVVLCAFEQHRWLVRIVVLSAKTPLQSLIKF